MRNAVCNTVCMCCRVHTWFINFTKCANHRPTRGRHSRNPGRRIISWEFDMCNLSEFRTPAWNCILKGGKCAGNGFCSLQCPLPISPMLSRHCTELWTASSYIIKQIKVISTHCTHCCWGVGTLADGTSNSQHRYTLNLKKRVHKTDLYFGLFYSWTTESIHIIV